MYRWNALEEPIAERLRNDIELEAITNTKTMMYHEPTGTTALIMDVWIVSPDPNFPESVEEDRYVQYATEFDINEEFSVELDSDGWLWFDELKELI
tara:strand:- start:583 stop:870 length:288 start_codon:yes stop_codon:yes gene_type:complete